MLRELFGCMFSHRGKWGPVVEERYVRADAWTGMTIAEYDIKVQYRVCDDCGVVEKRRVQWN